MDTIIINFSGGIYPGKTSILGEATVDGNTITLDIEGVLVQDDRVPPAELKDSTGIRIVPRATMLRRA